MELVLTFIYEADLLLKMSEYSDTNSDIDALRKENKHLQHMTEVSHKLQAEVTKVTHKQENGSSGSSSSRGRGNRTASIALQRRVGMGSFGSIPLIMSCLVSLINNFVELDIHSLHQHS